MRDLHDDVGREVDDHAEAAMRDQDRRDRLAEYAPAGYGGVVSIERDFARSTQRARDRRQVAALTAARRRRRRYRIKLAIATVLVATMVAFGAVVIVLMMFGGTR